jgi:hypothetical protein
MCQVAFTDGLGGEKEMTGCKGGTCVTVSLRNLNFCVHNHNLGLSMKGWKGKSQRGYLKKGAAVVWAMIDDPLPSLHNREPDRSDW